MKVELDTRQLLEMMTLWRDATDMKVRLSDEAKLHMLAHRAQVLKNMVVAADHWRTVMQACTAEGEDRSELDVFRNEVASFRQRAINGLDDLRALGVDESRRMGGVSRRLTGFEAASCSR